MTVPRPRMQLSNDLAHELRRMIVTGELAPGEELVQSVWAEKLGVSRTPLRDALKQLARDGLITESNGNRTMKVSAVNGALLADMWVVRTHLEALGCMLAARRGLDGATTQQVERLLQEMEHAGAQGLDGILDWFRANNEFHSLLLKASGNSVLAQQAYLVGATSLASRANVSVTAQIDFMTSTNAEHRAVFEAVEEGRAEAAYALMKNHVGSRAGVHIG